MSALAAIPWADPHALALSGRPRTDALAVQGPWRAPVSPAADQPDRAARPVDEAAALSGRPRTDALSGRPRTDALSGRPRTDALVRLAKRGDAEAFAELVRRHQHAVFNLAYRFMRDQTLAEDMTQEAFLKAFRLIKRFRGDCAFGTWMYRVTCSVCLTELGRRKRRAEVPLMPHHDREAAVPPTAMSDMPELIRRCVAKLPRRYAAVITLYYLKEITYDEIAQIMQVPMGTLKTWMHRARKQLGQIVAKELEHHEHTQSSHFI